MKAIRGIDFARTIASGQPLGFYAFCGPETYLRDEALAALKRRLAGSEGGLDSQRYAVERYQAGEHGIQEIAIATAQAGLFGGGRLIVIDGLDRLSRVQKQSDREAWLSFVRGAGASNPVVLMSATGSRELSARSKLLAAVLAAVQVVEFWTLFPRDAARWLIERGRRDGLLLDAGAAAYLIDSLGTDLGVLAGELEKILLFKGPGRLTAAGLKDLVRAGTLGSSWECVESILQGRVHEAIARLQGVRREEGSFSFMWKLASATRAALLPGAGESRRGPGIAAKSAPAGPSADRRSDLARLLGACYEWERHIKQGRWQGPHDFTALEALIADRAGRARQAQESRNTG